MKVAGAILIIGICWLWGVDFYKSNIKKKNFAKGLYNGIGFLRTDIVYSCNFLAEGIIKSAEFSGDAAEFMKNIGNELNNNGVTLVQAFERTKQLLEQSADKATCLITKDLFLQLGETDCENQRKLIDGYLEKLSDIIIKQDEFCKKECTIIRKAGVIIGVGIAILLV